MNSKGMHLAWVVVADLKAAVKFYTGTLGFKVDELQEAFGWAELVSSGSSFRLGLAQYQPHVEVKAGSNAIITITVDDIATAREEMKKKGVKLLGDVVEVPGQVKMQTFSDVDGNLFQLCELLKKV